MTEPTHGAAFLDTRSGRGLLLFLCFCSLLASGVGYGFYYTNLSWFKEHKSEEKITALKLVDAFVTSYANLRMHLDSAAPVPATFQHDSLEIFNKELGADTEFRLKWVGRPGREISTPPSDPEMGKIIDHIAAEANPQAVAEFREIGGQLMFRTVYPSLAREQSCVDCHNELQAGKGLPTWHLNDVMGAFSIDVPVGPFLQTNRAESAGLALAIFIALGAVGGAIAVQHYRQAAEREAAQASLEESEARFRDFAESASDWFWEQDETLRYIGLTGGNASSHPANLSDLGKTRREVVGDGTSEEQWQAHDADLAAHRAFQNFRLRQDLPSGEAIHISVSGKPVFDATGRFKGYRGTGRDVTREVEAEVELAHRVEQRTAELRLAQSELLRKERLSTLGQLTATMAHELRNPLSAIRNTLFSLKESLAKSGLALDRPIGRMERSVGRCDRIINDLLDYTRLRELQCSSVTVDGWLDEVLNEHKPGDGIELVRHLDAAGCTLDMDGERMRRVVINLIENAAQAMGEPIPGSAPVAERRITVATQRQGDHLALTIEDSGAGIPAEVLPRVFEPLFSTKSFGTGLGLPMVKQIVEQHGGTIEITSEIGRGTRVSIRLPTRQAREIAA